MADEYKFICYINKHSAQHNMVVLAFIPNAFGVASQRTLAPVSAHLCSHVKIEQQLYYCHVRSVYSRILLHKHNG